MKALGNHAFFAPASLLAPALIILGLWLGMAPLEGLSAQALSGWPTAAEAERMRWDGITPFWKLQMADADSAWTSIYAAANYALSYPLFTIGDAAITLGGVLRVMAIQPAFPATCVRKIRHVGRNPRAANNGHAEVHPRGFRHPTRDTPSSVVPYA